MRNNPLKKGIGLFQKYVKNKFIRFLFVGGLNTVFGYSVYCMMILIGLSYVWATVIQQILGVLFNFMTTGTIVFENHDRRLLVKFVMTYILTYFVSVSFNKSIQDWFNFNTYFSGFGGTLVAALLSFFLLRYFVFKEENKTYNKGIKDNE